MTVCTKPEEKKAKCVDSYKNGNFSFISESQQEQLVGNRHNQDLAFSSFGLRRHLVLQLMLVIFSYVALNSLPWAGHIL